MELAVLLGVLVILLALGVPVAFALLGATLAAFFVLDIPAVVAVQRVASGMSVFSLMAIPFFIFAGELMHRAGIAERLVRIAEAAFGRSRGGLGQVDVGASMLFGAVSGSAVASVSALGSTLMPMMKKKGYHTDYAVNVTSTSAVVGLLIPPSHNMIIYAAAAGVGVSVGELFIAGIVPGLLTGAFLMFVAWLVAVRRNYPRGEFPGWPAFVAAFAAALPGLMTAVIIVGGILGGFFTATESSSIAVIYTLAVAFLVYRSLSWTGFVEATLAAAKTTAMVLFIIGAASGFGWVLAILETPTQLADAILALTDNPIFILLIINLILLMLGTFMDMSPLIVITTPIFLPIAVGLGIDPVHFGVIMMLNLGIGLVTPPVGSVLFVGAAVGGMRMEETIKTIWPFYGALVAALMAITYLPFLSMGLVDLMRG
ncbi:MAG: TRAP transporter large permease [Oceanicaulis sp.]|uniref:TRAP transporter large permease n=1 Tax=Glycocaulis sp. TaxID=1969725 RepID=UPI0025C62672|nr:TRAP transporter large permease [Glycocaulis sp.]MCC5981075.1 TRAP transporter large permease [Oceanicaulis sp.]MCH8521944.1 TRAP transporter large permease [Glycocaulis sp.]